MNVPRALLPVFRSTNVVSFRCSLLQEIYSSLVKKMRFGTVRVVEDGILALEAIEEALPHVVLMDIEMPRMNGPE